MWLFGLEITVRRFIQVRQEILHIGLHDTMEPMIKEDLLMLKWQMKNFFMIPIQIDDGVGLIFVTYQRVKQWRINK